MKVILTQELKGRGSEGDIIEVARGFAVNYLFPRKIAVEATAGNRTQLEARRHVIDKRESARREDAAGIAERLQNKTVVIGAKVGEGGRLYGSVTPQMVEDAILTQLDVDIDRRKLEIHSHIKDLGDHVVAVSLHRDVKTEITVRVVSAEEGVAGAAAKTSTTASRPSGMSTPEEGAQSAVARDEQVAGEPAIAGEAPPD